MPNDTDLIARRLISRYGSGARAEAAAWVHAMWQANDPENAIVWAQVSAAVTRLLEAELRRPAAMERPAPRGGLQTA